MSDRRLVMGLAVFFLGNCGAGGRRMRVVVMKFGGSSVVDAAAIARVLAIVDAERQRGNAPVLVVSAMGGVTDALLELAHAARAADERAVSLGLDALLDRHLQQATQAGVDHVAIQDAFGESFTALRAALDAMRGRGDSDGRALDAGAAAGELLSSRLVAAAMTARSGYAAWVDARDLIVTDDRYTCATPLVDETNTACEARLRPLLAAGRVPVLGGFIGRALDGSTTTLGRGGSDYTASIIGAALNADAIQIWTDVD